MSGPTSHTAAWQARGGLGCVRRTATAWPRTVGVSLVSCVTWAPTYPGLEVPRGPHPPPQPSLRLERRIHVGLPRTRRPCSPPRPQQARSCQTVGGAQERGDAGPVPRGVGCDSPKRRSHTTAPQLLQGKAAGGHQPEGPSSSPCHPDPNPRAGAWLASQATDPSAPQPSARRSQGC